MEKFLDVITKRKSVKHYEKNVKIKRKEILAMLDYANTAPSAYNLQPWRYIIVDTKKNLNKLKKINYNKTQQETSSATIIVLADKNYADKYDEIYNEAVEKKFITVETKEKLKQIITSDINSQTENEKLKNIIFDCALWVMQFCNVAKSFKYDTNIMGGFNKEELRKQFNIEENYEILVLISLGKVEKQGYKTTRIQAKKLAKFI